MESLGPAVSAPLRRLVRLRDDPAAAWLSPTDSLRAFLWGMIPWVVAGMLWSIPASWVAMRTRPYPQRNHFFGRRRNLPPAAYALIYVSIPLGLALLPLFLWTGGKLRSRVVLSLARRRALAETWPADDWEALGQAPDGQPVSVVGWARGREHLGYLIDGQPCLGVSLGCRATVEELWSSDSPDERPHRQRYAEVMEVLHDFDLIDESGRTLPIRVAGARLIGARNVGMLGDDDAEQRLLAALNLPAGVKPLGKKTFVVRDGDPLLVIGFKTTSSQGSRPAVASGATKALLVCAIRAEHRDVRASFRS